MRVYRSLLALSSLFCALPCFATDEAEVVQALTKDLSERVITITKPVYAYHWLPMYMIDSPYETGAIRPSASKEEIDWLKSALEWRTQRMSSRFWSEFSAYGLVGGGIYSARDPVSSSRYGAYGETTKDNGHQIIGSDYNNPILVTYRIDPGAKLFDLRATRPNNDRLNEYNYGNAIYIRPKTQAALREFGCNVGTEAHIRDSWLAVPNCSKFLRKAMGNLGIVGNVHSWWSSRLVGCVDNSDAFDLFDGTYFTSNDRMHFYTRETILDPTFQNFSNSKAYAQEWKNILSFLLENQHGSFPYSGNPQKFTSLFSLKVETLNSKPDDDYSRWKSENLFHCDTNTPEETTLLPSWKN